MAAIQSPYAPHGGINRLTVLVIDSRLESHEMAYSAFREMPVRVESALTSDEALEILNTGKITHTLPDLILLAWVPDPSSHELLRTIKTDDVLRKIPVIVLSPKIGPELAGAIYDLHANCVVEEPSRPEEQVRVMERIRHFWMFSAQLPGSRLSGF